MDDIRRFEAENTVSAAHQVKNNVVGDTAKGGLRILFVGNSITLHGPNAGIGWNVNWGMAASSEEKDYVHQVMSRVRSICPDAEMRIAQAAEWERAYWTGEEVLVQYAEARDWAPDIVVIRLGENTPGDMLAKYPYAPAFKDMMDYFTRNGEAKLIVTELFWPNPEKDAAIAEAAKAAGAPLVHLNDLGTMDEMKALGLFEHSGVAAHPGDLGMETIACRIFDVLKTML